MHDLWVLANKQHVHDAVCSEIFPKIEGTEIDCVSHFSESFRFWFWFDSEFCWLLLLGCCLSGCNLFTKLNWLNEIGHNLVNSFRFLCGKRLSYDAELCVRLTHFGALQVTTTTKLNGKTTVRAKNVFSKYLLINLSKTRRLNRCLPPCTPSFRKYSVWYQRWHKDDKFRPFCH